MSKKDAVLNWPGGAGWLVMTGGGADPLGDLRGYALNFIMTDGGVAYVGFDNDDHEDLIEDLGELGAPTGYLVNVMTEDDDTIREMLTDSSMVLLPDVPFDYLYSAMQGAGIEGLSAAYARGAVILAEGQAATLFGQVMPNGVKGLAWLENTFIVPNATSLQESELAREALDAGAASYVISVGPGSALALGPKGRIETLGKKEVTVALGGQHD
jgi:hypothetical protein